MSICENALLQLHQPIILQNFVSCKHLKVNGNGKNFLDKYVYLLMQCTKQQFL